MEGFDEVLEAVLNGPFARDEAVLSLTERWVTEWLLREVGQGKWPADQDLVRLVDRFYPMACCLVDKLHSLRGQKVPLEGKDLGG